MEDNKNGIGPKLKRSKMEDDQNEKDQNGSQPKWKTTWTPKQHSKWGDLKAQQ